MAKYLMLWSLDRSKLPISPQERAVGWRMLIDMVKQDLQEGRMKDWGVFVGEMDGYGIMEGTELEVAQQTQKYVPFVDFKVHPVASVDMLDELVKSMSG